MVNKKLWRLFYLLTILYFPPSHKRLLAMPEEFHVKMGIICSVSQLRPCSESVKKNFMSSVLLYEGWTLKVLMKNFPFFSHKLLSWRKKIFENKTISSLCCCQSAHPLQIFARMSPVSENSQKIQYRKLVRHKKISPGPCTKKKLVH